MIYQSPSKKDVLLLNSADCFQRGSILSAEHDRQPKYSIQLKDNTVTKMFQAKRIP